MRRQQYTVSITFILESGLTSPEDIEEMLTELNERGLLMPEAVDRGEPLDIVFMEVTPV